MVARGMQDGRHVQQQPLSFTVVSVISFSMRMHMGLSSCPCIKALSKQQLLLTLFSNYFDNIPRYLLWA